MKYILHTDVLSALRRPERNPLVRDWVKLIDEGDLTLSVVTLGEIRRGIEKQRTTAPAHATALEAWLNETEAVFEDRVFTIDRAVCDAWGRMTAVDPHHLTDALIAATARVHGLTVVTRNIRHFQSRRVPLLNPFDPSP